MQQHRDNCLPASRYITPVMRIALIWRAHMPNDPSSAALPKIIMHTSEHDMDRFCIPVCTETTQRLYYSTNFSNVQQKASVILTQLRMIVGRKAGVAPQLLAAIVRIYTVRHVVDATLRPREPKVSQVPQVLLVQVNAQRPNAAVHRHQKQVLVAALLRC